MSYPRLPSLNSGFISDALGCFTKNSNVVFVLEHGTLSSAREYKAVKIEADKFTDATITITLEPFN